MPRASIEKNLAFFSHFFVDVCCNRDGAQREQPFISAEASAINLAVLVVSALRRLVEGRSSGPLTVAEFDVLLAGTLTRSERRRVWRALRDVGLALVKS